MKVLLTRNESSDQGTFGRISVGDLALFTGELPWRDNQANVSCIPTGVFECVWTWSARFKRYMYEVKIPGRVGIRLGVRVHSANYCGDSSKNYKCQLHGCIALGEKIGWMDKQKALLVSRPAVSKFENFMEQKPFELEIKNVSGM